MTRKDGINHTQGILDWMSRKIFSCFNWIMSHQKTEETAWSLSWGYLLKCEIIIVNQVFLILFWKRRKSFKRPCPVFCASVKSLICLPSSIWWPLYFLSRLLVPHFLGAADVDIRLQLYRVCSSCEHSKSFLMCILWNQRRADQKGIDNLQNFNCAEQGCCQQYVRSACVFFQLSLEISSLGCENLLFG